MAGLLRVDLETEESGNDMPKHGESAYPADAWVEMQYKKNVKERERRNSHLPPHMSGLPANTVNAVSVLKSYRSAFHLSQEHDLYNRHI